MKLTVSLYPESANTYDSLAEIQEAAATPKEALVSYRKSLKLIPRTNM